MVPPLVRAAAAALALTMAGAVGVARADVQDYDGLWFGTYRCADWRSTANVQARVEQGRLTAQARWGTNGAADLSGRIAEDGSFRINGRHTDGSGTELSFSGKATAATLEASGSGKPFNGGGFSRCTLSLDIARPAPESAQGKALAAERARETAALQEADTTQLAPQPASAPVPPGAPIQVASAPVPAVPASAAPVEATPVPAASPAPTATSCALPSAPVRAAAAGPDLRPKLYVLSVGVSRYVEASMNLSFAAKDACDMARLMAAQQGGLYRQVEARVIQDEAATRDGMLDGLEWVVRQTTARDVAMVFLAGHGVNDATGEYFFLPHDANLDRLARTSLPQSDIKRSLMQVPGKALFFVDTCHSGQIMASRRALPPDIGRFVQALATAENSMVVFSASTGRQFAIEDPRWSNGAFTKALLEGLSGEADYKKDRVITVNELDLYLSERVKELTGGRQAPTSSKPASTQDFPIAAVRR